MKQRSPFMVFLIFLIFFVISFLTNIMGPLVPDIIRSFRLSLTLVALLPFSFFIAYGVMSIPAGMLIERFKEKPIMTVAFLVAFLGALLFALFPNYAQAVFSLFLIGAGMAMLQVAINPLLRTAGGEEHFAFNSVAAQLVFGGASFLSPLVYSHLVSRLPTAGEGSPALIRWLARLTPGDLPWVSLYWIFAAVSLVMALAVVLVRFPAVERTVEERAGAWEVHRKLFRKKIVLLYFVGIFAYVGTEQGVANWISQFLAVYHKLDPQVTGARAVSRFWGLMAAGCLLGLLTLKIWDSRKVLVGFTSAAVLCLTFGLFGTARVSLIAFPMLGFCASVMWSIVFSLALNSLDSHHGSFSGILVTGIIGGAVVPLIIGWLGDRFGLRAGMLVLYLTLGYVLSIGIWARPLIANKTISFGKTD